MSLLGLMFDSCLSPIYVVKILTIFTASYRLGEAFSEIKEKTGVDNYNVRLTVSLPQKEGEEDKKVIIDSPRCHSVTVSTHIILIDWFRHRSLWKMESFTQKEQDVCRKVTIV